MVFLFRLASVPERRLLGWAAVSDDRRECVVLNDGTPESHQVPTALWPQVQREVSQSLPTQPLPETSALHQAFSDALLTDYRVEYVACVPTEALPDLHAAVEWLDRSLA